MRELRSNGVNYRIQEILGIGQSATVFKAIREDSKGYSQQTVALKLFHGTSSVSWLRREFETLARVNSRYCVRLLALENMGEQDALILELVEGVSLYQFARNFELNDELVGEIVAQVQEGLRALAHCGLHHGDLSPKNIMIDREGFVRLIDFATDPDGGCRRGTPLYMAPELWEGAATGLEADLFSLGLIAHDLKCGFERTGDEKLPEMSAHCRSRSRKLAIDDADGLLAREPHRRKMSNSESNHRVRVEIANLVAKIHARRIQIETALIEQPMKICEVGKTRYVLGRVVSFLMIVTFPINLKTASATANRGWANISIRSQAWLQISVNGRKVGYTPLEIKNLRPGPHRLSWTGHAGGGEVFLDLAPGENKMLTEMDLAKQSAFKRN